MAQDFDEMLAHFGVRGMRWGSRKKGSSEKSSEDKKDGKKDKAEDTKKTADKKADESDSISSKKTSNKKHNVDDLSDAQLRDALNRLQMEKQYRDLTAAPPGKLAAGRKFAQEAMRQVAMKTAVSIGTSHASKATARFMATPNPKSAQATMERARAVVAKGTT